MHGLGVHLPDPARAVGVACGPVEHAGPEHEPLKIMPALVLVPLVGHFSVHHRHRRRLGVRHGDLRHGDRSGGPLVVRGLEKIKVHQGFILHNLPARLHLRHTGRMHGHQVLVRIVLTDILRHIIQIGMPHLTRDDPDDGVRPVARDQIAPVAV